MFRFMQWRASKGRRADRSTESLYHSVSILCSRSHLLLRPYRQVHDNALSKPVVAFAFDGSFDGRLVWRSIILDFAAACIMDSYVELAFSNLVQMAVWVIVVTITGYVGEHSNRWTSLSNLSTEDCFCCFVASISSKFTLAKSLESIFYLRFWDLQIQGLLFDARCSYHIGRTLWASF